MPGADDLGVGGCTIRAAGKQDGIPDLVASDKLAALNFVGFPGYGVKCQLPDVRTIRVIDVQLKDIIGVRRVGPSSVLIDIANTVSVRIIVGFYLCRVKRTFQPQVVKNPFSQFVRKPVSHGVSSSRKIHVDHGTRREGGHQVG
ncbi:MAG: hypothetical protein JWM04_884, partial [Verrucomicrobiales bacterium]|nr:hypothetical protein [Verrucomicrobiales bacterium]